MSSEVFVLRRLAAVLLSLFSFPYWSLLAFCLLFQSVAFILAMYYLVSNHIRKFSLLFLLFPSFVLSRFFASHALSS